MKPTLTAAATTGELPIQVHGADFGGRDDFPFAIGRFVWAGCLDATDQIPAGSVVPVNISPEIGGYGYEGNVSRIVER